MIIFKWEAIHSVYYMLVAIEQRIIKMKREMGRRGGREREREEVGNEKLDAVVTDFLE